MASSPRVPHSIKNSHRVCSRSKARASKKGCFCLPSPHGDDETDNVSTLNKWIQIEFSRSGTI